MTLHKNAAGVLQAEMQSKVMNTSVVCAVLAHLRQLASEVNKTVTMCSDLREPLRHLRACGVAEIQDAAKELVQAWMETKGKVLSSGSQW